MSLWAALPAWMRRVPVVGWLAGLLVIVGLLWLRSRRIAAAEQAHAEAVASVLRARMALDDAQEDARAGHADETARIRRAMEDAQGRATAERARIDRLRGQSLADEMNRAFGRK